MNERITELIVRKYLINKGYYEDENILIEEQASLNPRINKLLKTASKSGKGVGRPEFIISFKNYPDNIMIIECKASIFKHESTNRDKYKDYAVDGVLCYASYLKESFNTTAIAISGESERDLKLSTFLWLKQNFTYKDIQNKIFLNPEENLSIIKKASIPLNENELIKKAVEYNNFLHKYSIPEVERCTLISAILIALQDKAFLSGYKFHLTNKSLIQSLIQACKNVLETNGMDYKRSNIIISEYSKFKDNEDFNKDIFYNKNTKKEEANTILRDFVTSISEDILPYINESNFDILGKFYTQFIRYAGSDAKTGLVLTPTHITDFFCDIANLSVDDIVFDPCCGTAGFLVSAMNYMIKKAGDDSQRLKKIKSEQLIGIEKRTDMFSHACSNMMMRGDGKSKILFGSCFDNDKKEQVREFKPNVGMLNPPYQDGNAEEQLEFVENTLSCLTKGGTCISICQVSTVVSSKPRVVNIRKRLLEKHTLRAVLSMPDDLFPTVGVITCILVFSANIPHPSDKEVFFGYFKDDGFIKTKNKGRTDIEHKWQIIKNKWIELFLNNKSEPGISITSKITAVDEWCAEAFIETDYSKLNQKNFETTIRNYVAFLVKQNWLRTLNQSEKTKTDDDDVVLNFKTWKKFEIGELFNLKRGSFSSKPKKMLFENEKTIPYISSTEFNNGQSNIYNISSIDGNLIEKKECITLANNGSVGCCFFQPVDFLCSSDVTILRNKNINKYNALFLTTIIEMEKFKFNYGRKWNNNKVANTKIFLPSTIEGYIDWQFMEIYIKKLKFSENI